ncbi:MAG: HAMP domain-containing protein [Actinobacteria bacterium]|nr:HAMP domain-containing protein [Actinomycetota bacterium]
MRRMPIRLRLALTFAAAMAVVLGAVGAVLYIRLEETLNDNLDGTLRVRTATLAAASPDIPLPRSPEEEFAQIYAPDGTLEGSSVGPNPLVPSSAIERARSGEAFVESRPARALDGEPARILVTRLPGRNAYLAVGASLEDRNEALAGLVRQLLVVGPLALLLSSLAGYLLAGAALRPVDRMRRRAAEISTDRPGQRLPLPESRDEVRRLGETLNAMLSRLEASFARERQFVSDASHELRTPLALLQAELDLALRRPRSREELEQAIRSAGDEVSRLTRLAEDLLVLARADEGALPVNVTMLSPDELLGSVARRFEARALQEGRVLSVDSQLEGPLLGDRLRLEQALGNLVDNALRHGRGAVRLAAAPENGRVELRVEDEGPGFPPEYLPRAFERFSRADEARGGGAAGLGLAIVDVVARAHGGEAKAVNLARGAVVSLLLPTQRTA